MRTDEVEVLGGQDQGPHQVEVVEEMFGLAAVVVEDHHQEGRDLEMMVYGTNLKDVEVEDPVLVHHPQENVVEEGDDEVLHVHVHLQENLIEDLATPAIVINPAR